MSKIIEAENLGKKYIIRHETKERYTALRDEIAEKAKKVGKRILRPFNANSVQNPKKEEFWALKDISFQVEQGERIGIIGHNGAGKSTLLKILSRITEPTTGSVHLRGRVASLLEVGTGFHPELTGRENIFLNGAIMGMTNDEIKKKFDEIVDFAEVDKFLDTPVKRYSSGMAVRLAFAVAAHLEPEILIVDEVLAVGDARFQKKCLGKMEAVGKEGRTVIFVSHNMAAIQILCTHVIWLDSGRLVGQGDVSEQIRLYLNSQQYNKSNIDKTVKLIGGIELRNFELNPNPVENCVPVNFVIELQAPVETKLYEIVMLFHTYLGIRVGIIDLRKNGQAYTFDRFNTVSIKGKINGLTFVEGNYQVGLFVNDGKKVENYLNLLDLKVAGKPETGSVVPYPLNSRGIVELNADVFD